MTEKTIFSKILEGTIECDEVYSDKLCIAFRDIEPKAPVHILVIPRKPITSLKELFFILIRCRLRPEFSQT